MLLCCVGYLKRISKMKNKEQNIFPFLERLLDGAEVEWKMIGEVSTQISGMSGVSNKWASKGNCRFIDYLNAYKHIKIDISQLPFATVKKLNQMELKQGDILFTSASETPEECAISSVIEDKINAGVFLDDHLFGIRINEEYKEIIDSSFLNYYFRSPDFRKIVNKAVRGVTRFYISKVAFMRLFIPIPPLSVQKRIVEILDKFTTLEAELEAELTIRRRQHSFYRSELLARESLQKRVGVLEYKTLGDLFETRNGYTPSKRDHTAWDRDDVPWFRMEDIRENGGILESALISISNSAVKAGRVFPANSILVATSATIGAHALVTVEHLSNQRFTSLQPKEIACGLFDPYFLYYYCFLLDEYCLNHTNVSSFASVDMRAFRAFEFPILPLDVQCEIASILDQFTRLETELEAEIEARRSQCAYYRDRLLSFPEKKAE